MRQAWCVERRLRTRAWSELRRIVALVAVLAVVTGALLAGHRYFYCGPMQRIALTECCAGGHAAHDDGDEAGPALERTGRRCCTEGVFDAGDAGFAPPRAELAPPLAALPVALVSLDAREIALPRATAAHPTRGPPRAGPISWRLRVDVSLT